MTRKGNWGGEGLKLLDNLLVHIALAARSASSNALLTFDKNAGSFPMGMMRD